jgi:hypothetical protein
MLSTKMTPIMSAIYAGPITASQPSFNHPKMSGKHVNNGKWADNVRDLCQLVPSIFKMAK